jgi:hypothetical protein
MSLLSCLIGYSFAMVTIVAVFSVRYTLRQKQLLSMVVHGYHGYHLCYHEVYAKVEETIQRQAHNTT